MPNFNPFSDDNENTSFEQGMPINQAAKNVTKTSTAQAQKQVDDTTKAIVAQLYGATPDGQDQGTDEANTSHLDHSNAASRAAAHAGSGKPSHSASNSSNSNQTPEEQAKLEKVRHELFANYGSKFKTAQNGPFTITTDLEQEMEKARREREQKEMQRKHEEEEEERRKKEEEEQKQDLAMPAGKKTGVMMGRKQQQPMEVQLAKTRTESNRGTSG